MNKEEILNMPASRELDALIAERVMGLEGVHKGSNNYDYYYWTIDVLTHGEPILLYPHIQII
jgi:hypothetical protein